MDYKERLVLEYKGLVEKRELLERALNSDEPKVMDEQTLKLLREQLEVMLRYEEILFIRITSMMK